jgi:hypothetical protein
VSGAKARLRPFFDLYCRSEVTAEQIDDFVGRWHNAPDSERRSLSDYLGMTEEEYGVWVMDTETLPLIRTARMTGRPLKDAIEDYVAALMRAVRPVDQSAVLALVNWLDRQRRGVA